MLFHDYVLFSETGPRANIWYRPKTQSLCCIDIFGSLLDLRNTNFQNTASKSPFEIIQKINKRFFIKEEQLYICCQASLFRKMMCGEKLIQSFDSYHKYLCNNSITAVLTVNTQEISLSTSRNKLYTRYNLLNLKIG